VYRKQRLCWRSFHRLDSARRILGRAINISPPLALCDEKLTVAIQVL
jgi:hypothetical protein